MTAGEPVQAAFATFEVDADGRLWIQLHRADRTVVANASLAFDVATIALRDLADRLLEHGTRSTPSQLH